MNIRVESAGFLSSVQDLGRPGFRQSGVPLGGALDSHALRVANALVGNGDEAAGLEVTFGTLRLSFADDRAIAWCGAPFSVRVGDQPIPAGRVAEVRAGRELTMIAPTSGGRAWLAISGGIDVPLVLGSRATDLRGNFGGLEGRALRDGDMIGLGKEARLPSRPPQSNGGLETAAPWGAPAGWAALGKGEPILRVVRGTDWDRFTAAAQRSLVSGRFTVTRDSDRMGVRLEGPELERCDHGDLLSEAVAPGTIQVPPNGKPIVLLNDCQTVGGYPKIAHVITVDLPLAAQLFPGDTVRFGEVTLAEAQMLLREREQDFARFRVGLSLHRR
jgi:antagonist of KipI